MPQVWARTPWFTLTAVASLAIGIGLNTALFSAIEAVLLRPVPYPTPDRIVKIDQTADIFGGEIGVWPAVFEEWQKRATSFESLGVYDPQNFDAVLREGSLAERVDVMRVSSGVLAVLGIPPLIGRPILPEDDRPGSRVAVLSHEFWLRRWNGATDVLGRDLLIDGAAYRIVGVMPASFRIYHYPGMDRRMWSDVYLSDPWIFGSRSNRWTLGMTMIARLKHGVTLESAKSEVALLASTTEYGVPPIAAWGAAKLGGTVTPWEVVAQEVPSRLLLVWGIASFVLLLAAANLANLLLARAGTRRQELGIRAAIGASRARLVRQLLTESVMLSLLGGLAGLTIAVWAGTLVATFIPDTIPMWRLSEAGVNWRVLGFMMAVAILTGVAFGVAPALRGSRENQRTMLLPSGRMTDTKATIRTRNALLVAQLALSLVLLAGAGLMVTTMFKLWTRPQGFESDDLITFFVRLPRGLPYVSDLGLSPDTTFNPSPGPEAPLMRHWAPTPTLLAVRQSLVERLRTIPGVSAATVATGIPNVRSLTGSFTLPNRPSPTPEQRGKMQAIMVRALPGYFDTLRMQLLAGRDISWEDQRSSRRVAVINRHLAMTYWPHESRALGDMVLLDDDRLPYEVVGIVGDARFWMWDGEAASKIFVPYLTDPSARFAGFMAQFALQQNVAVRTTSRGAAAINDIRRAVAEVAEGTPIEQVRSMTTAMKDASGNTPGITLLLSAAAAIALLLAAIGIFGIVSYTVTQRTQEIGIRVALGASRGAIMGLVLSGAAWLALAGVGLGVVASFWLTRFIAGELFPGVSPVEPRVFGGGACLLVAIVLLATWLPARRAAAVDPVVALRAE